MFLVCHCTVTMLVFWLICKLFWPPVTVFMKLYENLFCSISLIRLSLLHCKDSEVEGRLSQVTNIVSFHTTSLSYPTWDTNSSFLQVEGSPRHLLQQTFVIFRKIYHSRTHAHLIVASSDSIYLRHCWGPPHASRRIYANVLYSGISLSHCVTETILTVECSYSWLKKWYEL